MKYNDLTLQDQLEMWRAIQNQFVADSEQYAAAEDKIFDLREQIQDEYLDKVKEINKKITDLEDSYQNSLEKRTQEIFNSYKLFDEIPERQKESGRELTRNLENQISVMREFYDGLQELAERGVGEALVEDIRAMGPSAVDKLDALLDMSDDRLSEYADLYQEKQQLANQTALKELEGLRKETNAQITENLEDLKKLYDDNAPVVGKAFTAGLAEGIRDGKSTVINSAVSMAQAAVSAVQDTLGIHSPSRVFAGIGRFMAEGLAQGWEQQFDATQRSITDGLSFDTVPVSFGASGLGRATTGMVNSLFAAQKDTGGSYTINLVVDGRTLANAVFDPLKAVSKQRGEAFA